MNNNTTIIGLDIGNGYVKGSCLGLNNEISKIDIPACVAGLVSGLAVPDLPSDEYVSDIFNRIVCQFRSSLIVDHRYFTFGQGAIATGHQLIEFDIADANLSKAQQELSSILILSSVAGSALKHYWEEHKELPTEVLHVDAQVALALPINEYIMHRERFAQQFTKGHHEVTICNFEQNVHVVISFGEVKVLPEGISAQFAIVNKGALFIQALLDDIRSRDADAMDGITAMDVIKCNNTCGIDIGEGTVNFPVITEGRFNVIASSTIPQGYGSVIEQSLASIQKANMPWRTRKAVANFMQQPETAFNRSKKKTVDGIINAESVDLVNAIIREVSRILSTGNVEVIYVYGGGATPMKSVLHDKLIEKTKSFTGGDAFPILYLDSAYARNLNREGLYDVALANHRSHGTLPETK